jgi:hypothetical protein
MDISALSWSDADRFASTKLWVHLHAAQFRPLKKSRR